MVSVGLAPLPPNTTLPFGTNVILLELPLTVRFPGSVSASPTMKGIGPIGVFSGVVWSGISLMVGAVLPPPAAYSTRSKGAWLWFPSKDSAVRSPVPVMMMTMELPLDHPGRFTISWIIEAIPGVC